MSTKENGATKGAQTNNYTFGSRPPVKVTPIGVKMKPKQGLIQIKKSDSTNCNGTGKENSNATNKQGKSYALRNAINP